MSIRYLDFRGAVSFWTNIKNFILSKIPTKTSELTNDSGFLTQHQSLSNYVTLNSEQTIAGKKLFTNSTTKVNSVNTFIGSTLFIDTSASVPRGSFPETAYRVGRVYIGDSTSYNGAWFIVDPTIDTNKAYYRMVTTNPDNTDSTRFSITWDSTETGARCRKNVSTGDLLPYANNTYNLGSNNQKWDIGYIHNLIGSNKENASEDANNYYSTTSGSHMTFYTTTNGGTKLSNVPSAVNTHLESRTIRYLSSSDWIVEQICHNSSGLYYRKGNNNGWSDWKTFAFTNSNITGTAANVTGTVAIANGGTGATTRLSAVKALTNEAVASPTHFLAITTNWGKAGYTTVAQAKTVLGITGDMGSHSDSEYVHKTGNETISGDKTFGNGTLIVDNGTGNNVHGEIKFAGSRSGYIVADNSSDGVFNNAESGISILLQDSGKPLHVGSYKVDSNGRVFVDNTNKNPVLTVKGGSIKSSIRIPENDTSDNTFIISSELTYANDNPSKTLVVVFRQYDNADATNAIYSNTNNVTSLGIPTRRWSSVYATNYYYGSNNVEFSTKFVTTDTAQAIDSKKTFNNIVSINGDYLGNEASINQRTNICLRSNRDTADKSCAYISRFRQNKSQGALQTGDLQMIGFDVLENEVRTNNVFSIQCSGWVDNVPTKVKLLSTSSDSTFGSSTRPSKINDLNPSSLGMPDLSNGIDISSYITHLDKVANSYTPPANGYVFIRVRKTSLPIVSIRIQQNYGLMTSCETSDFSTWGTYLPVVAGNAVEIYVSADSLMSAIFYPCQGNV